MCLIGLVFVTLRLGEEPANVCNVWRVVYFSADSKWQEV